MMKQPKGRLVFSPPLRKPRPTDKLPERFKAVFKYGPLRKEVYGFGSIATHNRWTGKPHRHAREIARNLRKRA